jgi:hypothetical protein
LTFSIHVPPLLIVSGRALIAQAIHFDLLSPELYQREPSTSTQRDPSALATTKLPRPLEDVVYEELAHAPFTRLGIVLLVQPLAA